MNINAPLVDGNPNNRIATIANAIKPLDFSRVYTEADIAIILAAVKLAKMQETKKYEI